MNLLKLFFTFLFLICLFYIQAKPTEVIITKETSFKSEGNSSSKTISRLFPNDKVIFLNDCNFYYCKVELNGKIGWVKKRLIDKFSLLEKQLEKEAKTESISNEETYQSSEEDEKSITDNNFSNHFSGFHYKIIFVGGLLICILGYWIFKLFFYNKRVEIENEDLNLKYQGIINVDDELNKRKKEVVEVEKSRDSLRLKYHTEKEIHEKLLYESTLLKDDLYMAEFGVYQPQFDNKTSAIFQSKIKEIREKQKWMITKNLAIIGGEGMKINRKNRSMINAQKKLMIRAFNGECDNILKSVKRNNETLMEERILKSAEIINKIGEPQGLEILTRFSFLKILEMRTTYEFGFKKDRKKGIQKRRREKIID
ncbi:MAG: DUF4041 domain-containing protein [Saprospiraceae bacterium]